MTDSPFHDLQDVIDGLRARLQAELDTQLAAIGDRHAQAVARTRHEAEQAAEHRWAEQVEATRTEWSSRLALEVQNARADTEQRIATETMRARMEAEQLAAETTAAVRAEFEQRLADERRQAEQMIETERAAAEARLEARLADERRLAEEAIETHRAAEEARLEARLAEERRQAEDAIAAQRAAMHAQLEARLIEERRQADQMLDAERAAAQAKVDAERQRADAQLAVERERAEQAVAETRAALEAERRRAEAQMAAARIAGAPVGDAGRLLEAVTTIDEAHSLSDVLALTVAAAALEAPRAALFVLNGQQLEEWNVPAVPALSPGGVAAQGEDSGVLAEAVTSGAVAQSGNGTAAPAFAHLAPGRGAIAVPLMLGEEPVGALYGDDGPDGEAPRGWRQAVELLGRHASARLAYLTAVRTAQAVRLMHGGSGTATGDDQTARRYARLLVSEIKLYNGEAVEAGRRHRDLRRRLKPEIERARRLYDERVPASSPGRDACFEQELLQALADGDAALFG